MDKYKAEIGDKANFFFNGGGNIFGKILYIPVATGDSWIIITYHEGKEGLVSYIQTFENMLLHKKEEF